MRTVVSGYPRIGKNRELKTAVEKYLRGDIDNKEMAAAAGRIRLGSWSAQKRAGISLIPSNDFSLYDNMLDAAILFGLVPRAYREAGLSPLDIMFAMARGRQDGSGRGLRALPMRKWFNTNYHYIVPLIEDDMVPALSGTKPVDEYREAREAGVETRPVVVGPFTFLKLTQYAGERRATDLADDLADAYAALMAALRDAGASRIQLDEPCLVTDLDKADVRLMRRLYGRMLAGKAGLEVHLNVPFGDVRDCYREIIALDLSSISLDIVDGPGNLALIRRFGFPADKVLTAGIVNGRNVWKADLDRATGLLRWTAEAAGRQVDGGMLEIGTSCSLLHVPISLASEIGLDETTRGRLAFAEEKLSELVAIAGAAASTEEAAERNADEVDADHASPPPLLEADDQVAGRAARLTARDFVREPGRRERAAAQQARLNLPPLPTTTIGSFPQTAEVRETRALLKKGAITGNEYDRRIKKFVADCIALQEELGLDVLVHGEFERNDMVEFFGQSLEGFVITSDGWVQSYGTRCVKPPIIVADISRPEPVTIGLTVYAQGLTRKPVKGMLTGPVTILNWSFPREDISPRASAIQLALAVRDEVLDLEKNAVPIIQIDEAALIEKMPLRLAERNEYFNWAVAAFRLTHSGVRPETQIHTHMCYSDFTGIIREIDSMDADVITFESSRSNQVILGALAETDFGTAVGPGVYDIHSPRVPSEEEIETSIRTMLDKLGRSAGAYDGLWVNPDCGLKTRKVREIRAALANMVAAVRKVRNDHRDRT